MSRFVRPRAEVVASVAACLVALTAAQPSFGVDHLTSTDAATLTQQLDIVSTGAGWPDAWSAADTVLTKTSYSYLAWDEYFRGYFSTHSLTNGLNDFIGYPMFWWFGDDVHMPLQKGMIGPLHDLCVQPNWQGAIAAGSHSLATNPVGRQTIMNAQIKFVEMGTQPTLWAEPAQRQRIYDAYTNMMRSQPQIFGGVTLDPTAYPYYGTMRMQAQQVLLATADTLDHTRPAYPAAVKAELATTLGLSGGRADLFNSHSVVLMDNNMCSGAQIQRIDDLLDVIPANLHNLASITVDDFLGNTSTYQDQGYHFNKAFGSVNIFGTPIGAYTENSFPGDVSPGMADPFTAVLAHEINHTVDAYTIGKDPTLKARKDALVAAAGDEPMNYLRSMFDRGFFKNNPQEFFASIANEWFTDSEKTLELGLTRFDAGLLQPINQALFFADVYSCGTDATCFYTMDAEGNVTRQFALLGRNMFRQINRLTFGDQTYTFSLDFAGNVTGYEVTPEPMTAGLLAIGGVALLRRRKGR